MKKKQLLIIAFTFWLVSLLFLFLIPNSLQSLRAWLYDQAGSDVLYPISIYQAINAGSSMDFLTGSYIAFLDILVGFVLWNIFHNINIVLGIFLILQLTLTSFSLVYLSRQIYGENSLISALVLAFSAAPTFVYAVGWTREYPYFFNWHFHVSTLIVEIFALGIIIHLFFEGERQPLYSFALYLLGLNLLTVVATASDALFIPQFVIPVIALIACAFLLSIVKRLTAGLIALSLIFSTGIGLAIYNLPSLWGWERVPLGGNYVKNSLNLIGGNVQLFLTKLAIFWNGNNGWWLIWGGFYLICIGIAFVFIKQVLQKKAGKIKRRLLILFLFFIFQAGSTISSVIVTGNTENRYYLALFFIPFFWGWPYLLSLFQPMVVLLRKKVFLWGGYAGAVLSIIVLLWLGVTRGFPDLVNYYPPFVACVDQGLAPYGVSRGVAPYWQARPITLFSKLGLKVVQVDGKLQPFLYNTDSNGYKNPMDFLVISMSEDPFFAIDPAEVVHQYGEPTAKFNCNTSEIWVYNREQDGRFRDQFASFLKSSANFDKIGNEKFTLGAQLPTQVGQISGDDLVNNNELTPGVLSFGPYWSAAPGTYEFTIIYSSEAPKGKIPGTWDVMADDINNGKLISAQQLTKGNLVPGDAIVQGTFSVDKDLYIEVRTFYTGTYPLSIHSVSLKRTD